MLRMRNIEGEKKNDRKGPKKTNTEKREEKNDLVTVEASAGIVSDWAARHWERFCQSVHVCVSDSSGVSPRFTNIPKRGWQ